ncbi:MAG: 30S ribosome-binding factor RbfA [Acidimicrobiales bacterium]|jgi:ribosome-binding factor A|tara:strand:- start:10 stop:441 length:432 start_codon:yes stop_codon:yes gene_type:complete
MGRGAPHGRRPSGSARGYDRADRLNELLVRILAEEFERIDDDRLGFLTISAVETDRDLSMARVYVTSDAEDEELLEALGELRPRLHRAIGDQGRLRRVPPLVFVVDETARSADRIEEILRGLDSSDEGSAGSGEDGTSSDEEE